MLEVMEERFHRLGKVKSPPLVAQLISEVSYLFLFFFNIKYMYKISQPIFLSLFLKYRSFKKMYICKTFVRDACVCY